MSKSKWYCMLAVLIGLTLGRVSYAELTIEITQGVDNPTRIAVVPFGWKGPGVLPEDIAQIVAADLMRSGQFVALDRNNMLSLPSQRKDVFFRDWRILEQEYLLVGDIVQISPAVGYKVQYELYDVYKQTRVFGEVVTGGKTKLRDVAHLISDKIYEKLTGVPGAFSTRILYVTANRSADGKDKFQLQLADADGYRAQTILESNEPILSPDWSPDGKKIAYVSFESRRPAIYIQDLLTGQREKIPTFRGMNSSPAFSPDGKSLAMVLSRDGNPELYLMNMVTRQLTRLTNHFGIDTEPGWAADGKSLIFTSSRGGQPQIYRLTLATKAVKRLTFEGDYNARGRLSKDGRYLLMVHRRDGIFHIAVKDLVRDDLRILTQTKLDESPSIAPNGSMVIYATNYDNKGILAAVSIDGRVKFRLPSKVGDVREPSWSPY